MPCNMEGRIIGLGLIDHEKSVDGAHFDAFYSLIVRHEIRILQISNQLIFLTCGI